MIRKIIGVRNADVERKKALILLVNRYNLKQHNNCPELYTNKEETIQVEEQEKGLLVRLAEEKPQFKCRQCGEKYNQDFCSTDDVGICRWCSGEEK